MSTPTLLAATYDGALTVTAQWQAVDGVSEYTIGVLSGTQVVASGPAYGTFGTLQLQTRLDTPGTYQVAVCTGVAPNAGPWGNRLVVVTEQVAGLSAVYDGASVQARWTLPGPWVTGAEVFLTDTTTDMRVTEQGFTGSSGTLALAAPLDPAHAYTLNAMGSYGASLGPSTAQALPLVTAVPGLQAVAYDPGARAVTVVLEGAVPPQCNPGAALMANGTLMVQATGTGGTLVTISGVTLDPAVEYVVRPFWTSGAASGPYGAGAGVLVAAPVVSAASVSHAGEVTVAWENLPGAPYPTGGVVMISATGETTRQSTVYGATSATFTPSPALLPASSYQVRVASLRGPAQGPPGPAVPLVAGSKAVIDTSYDGRTVTALLSTTAVPNATGWRLVVRQNGETVAEGYASSASGTVDVGLDPGAVYAAAVKGEGQAGHGPVGTAMPVISALPGVREVAVSPTAVSVVVAPPASPAGIDHYQAVLFQGGREVAVSPLVAAGGEPTAVIAAVTAGETGFSVRARGVGIADDGAARGPLGAEAPVLAAAPVVTGVVLDGTQLRVTWALPAEPPGAIVSTTLTLVPGTGSRTAFTGQTGTSATLDLSAVTLDPTLTYALQAVCVGAVGSSPASAPVAVIPGTPGVTRAAYDGARVTAAWAWAQGASGAATAAGYRMVLRANGATVASAIVPGLDGSLPLAAPLDPAGTYQLAIDPLAAGTETVSATAVALLAGAPLLQSASVTGGGVSLAWAAAPAPGGVLTGYSAVFSSPGYDDQAVSVGSATSPATVALPTLPADPAIPVTVRLIATGTGVGGPPGNALAVPRSEVTGMTAAFDGSMVTLAWSGVAAPADAYLATLLANGTPLPSPALVTGTTASLPLATPSAETAYTATVTPRAGAAAGPSTPALPLVTAAPGVSSPAFDGRTLTATVAAPSGGGPAPDGYDVVILRNGVPVQSASVAVPTGESPISLPVGLPVEPEAAYALAVRARAGAATGPAARVPLVLAAPEVVSIAASADGTALTVTAGAGPIPPNGITLQAVLYTDGTPGPPQAVGNDGTVQLTLPQGSAFAVAVRATGGGATGPWSAPVPALTAAPALLSARYDGARLSAGWTGDEGGGYRVAVASAGVAIVQAMVAGTAAELAFPAAAGAAYALSVTQVSGVAMGPPATLALLTDPCAISAAAVAGTRTASVQWSGPQGATQVVPVISWGGGQTALPAQAVATPLQVALPAWVPNGAALSLRALTGAATGPAGNAAALLTTTPTGLSVSFSGGQVRAAWNAAPGDEVDGYAVTLTVGGAPATTHVPTPSASLQYDPADGAATVAVAATAGAGSGPPSGTVPVITASPSITAAAYDGAALTLTLTPPADANATATLVSLLSGGAVARQVTLGATGGSIDLPPGAWTARVRGTGTATEGPPPADDTVLVTATPAVSSIAFDALGGGCTVSWPVTAGAAAYALRLTDGAGVVASATITPGDGVQVASYLIAASTFSGQGSYAVSLRAQDSAAAPVATGPWSAPVPVLAAVPQGVSVRYDGATATVTWEPVASPLVTGYRVSSVVGGTATKLGDTTAPGGSYTLPADPADAPTIVVQALAGPAPGPPSPTADVLAQGLFLSSGTGVMPSIAPRTAATAGATPIVLYLPQLFVTPPDAGDLPSTPPFEFAQLGEDAAPFAYSLTIAATSPAWTFTVEARAQVLAAYQAMLRTLAAGTATPLGIRTVQEAISRAMPQAFAETLFYAYGLTPAAGWVDLKPGMVLRAEYESYQVPGGSTADSGFISGYVATATAEYEVASYLAEGVWLNGLDAFLATVVSAQGTSVPSMPADSSGRAQGAGGLVDAFFGQFQQPYCRLVYPPQVLPQNTRGSAYPYQSAVLLASSSLSNLDAATQNVRNGALPGGSVASFYFRGRATLTACIRVTVNDARVTVPVGTTVGNVLAGMGRRPPVLGIPLSGVRLVRPYGAAVLSDGAGAYSVGGGWNVRLDWRPGGVYAPNSDWLDLPLLHGDALAFGDA